MSTLTDTARRTMARTELKALRRSYNRHVAWQALVDAYREGRLDSLNVRKMPSKNAKHQMYATADRVRRLIGLDHVARPSSLPEIGALIDKAGAYLS